jgi:hypothetical protein
MMNNSPSEYCGADMEKSERALAMAALGRPRRRAAIPPMITPPRMAMAAANAVRMSVFLKASMTIGRGAGGQSTDPDHHGDTEQDGDGQQHPAVEEPEHLQTPLRPAQHGLELNASPRRDTKPNSSARPSVW